MANESTEETAKDAEASTRQISATIVGPSGQCCRCYSVFIVVVAVNCCKLCKPRKCAQMREHNRRQSSRAMLPPIPAAVKRATTTIIIIKTSFMPQEVTYMQTNVY